MSVMLPGTVYGVSWITVRKKGAELVHQSLVWAAWILHHQLFKAEWSIYVPFEFNIRRACSCFISFLEQNRWSF